MLELHTSPGAKVSIHNEEFLYFSGTSYLGATTHPQFIKILKNSMDTWGTSFGSSRAANNTLSIYKKSESYLKPFLQQEDALTLSSGTLAGLLTITVLQHKIDSFFHLPKTHPSILASNSKPLFINDTLNPLVQTVKNNRMAILCDAIPSLETTPYSFSFLDNISTNVHVTIVVDESHSFGVLGKNGCGIAATIPKRKNLAIVVVGSLGKAFGLSGGLVAGPASLISQIKELALFKGAAGMNPAFLDCFLNAKTFYKNQKEKLDKNSAYVFSKLGKHPAIKMNKTYPVLFHNDDTLFDYLFEKKIIITSFLYPTTGKKLNRIVLNAHHTKKQLDLLINQLLLF
ncbi:MAG: aminotransferase class I/II-fold pyridoxal phosphate-dependent enzyme [Polaribacter sp.]|nr:aminotransferase class I/II-fold pyridoxal phosphate-dependent enzyme [Polaribacter sp.]